MPFDFGTPTDASTPVAEFWRNALIEMQNGKRAFLFGLTRGNFEVSETAPGPPVTFRVYDWPIFSAGAAFVSRGRTYISRGCPIAWATTGYAELIRGDHRVLARAQERISGPAWLDTERRPHSSAEFEARLLPIIPSQSQR